MTVRDLLSRSLRLIGVLASGETADASMASDALTSMNGMIDSWKNVGLMIFENQVQSVTLTSGQQTYSIGLTGDLNVARPNSINEAYFVSNSIEYPISILTEAEWAAIPDKSTSSDVPTKLYYNLSFPLGEINFWPKPSGSLAVNLYTPNPVTKFSSINSTVEMPPGYEDLLVYGTAERIAPEYGKELTPKQDKILTDLKADIMRKNTTEEFMACDPFLPNQSGAYDIKIGGYR